MKIAAAILLLVGAAQAEELDLAGKARAHFEAGRAMYKLGNWAEALREFQAGYELAPRPQFLVNIAQAHRKLGDLPRAKEAFEKYLAASPPDSAERPQIERLIAELAREIAAQPPPVEKPPEAAAPVEPPPPVEKSPIVEKPAAPVALVEAPPPKKSFVKRHWWIFPVAGVVLAGVAVGIYFAVKPSTVGCHDAGVTCFNN